MDFAIIEIPCMRYQNLKSRTESERIFHSGFVFFFVFFSKEFQKAKCRKRHTILISLLNSLHLARAFQVCKTSHVNQLTNFVGIIAVVVPFVKQIFEMLFGYERRNFDASRCKGVTLTNIKLLLVWCSLDVLHFEFGVQFPNERKLVIRKSV